MAHGFMISEGERFPLSPYQCSMKDHHWLCLSHEPNPWANHYFQEGYFGTWVMIEGTAFDYGEGDRVIDCPVSRGLGSSLDKKELKKRKEVIVHTQEHQREPVRFLKF